MTRPYSNDLRERVVRAAPGGRTDPLGGGAVRRSMPGKSSGTSRRAFRAHDDRKCPRVGLQLRFSPTQKASGSAKVRQPAHHAVVIEVHGARSVHFSASMCRFPRYALVMF